MNTIEERVIKIFDQQIKREYKLNNGKKENCISYWNKILFLKSLELDLEDWRNIRGFEYWEEKKRLNGIESIKYTIGKIDKYKSLH